eukprot:221440-Hanusia_phi.AAC.1
MSPTFSSCTCLLRQTTNASLPSSAPPLLPASLRLAHLTGRPALSDDSTKEEHVCLELQLDAHCRATDDHD